MSQDRNGRRRPRLRSASAGDPVEQASESVLTAAIAAAQHGDEESFRLVYRAVQPLLLRYLRGLVGTDAEDVAAETWLQIARDLTRFRGDFDGFRGWAATIARHRAMDHVRRMRRRPSVPVPVTEFGDLTDDDADPAEQAMQAMSTEAAVRLIGTLPPDQAEAVLLRVVLGLDTATAARIMGKRPGAVRTAAYRGLRRLAERLSQLKAPDSGQPVAGTATGVTGWQAPTLRKTRWAHAGPTR